MKPGLKRIEATLDQLSAQGTDQQAASGHSAQRPETGKKTKPQARPKPIAKTVQPFPIPTSEPGSALAVQIVSQSVHPAELSIAVQEAAPPLAPAAKAVKRPRVGVSSETVQTFPVQENSAKTPALPKSKPPSISSHRHAANPNLAVGLLKEVETIVVEWQLELEQTVLEIQALYLEGPIVDGWLESHPYGARAAQPINSGTLRHAEIEHLMDYVEEICSVPQPQIEGEPPRTGYRLCGLDADGQLWFRPCPPQQVPYVSLAIARYQKLRLLLNKKQTLENRLNQLVQTLTMLHGQMREPM